MGSSPGLRESLLKLEEKAFQLVVDVRSMQVEFQAPEPGQESLNETSFLDVLHATPSLARACIACMGALPPVDQPFACGAEAGPGNNDPGCLRIMRLVCKSAGQAAMKAIGHWKLSFGSTFWADSSSLGMHEMDRLVQLLSSCNLKLLNVCLGASDLDMTSVGTEAAVAYAHAHQVWLHQLPRFILGAGPALRSVSQLFISALPFSHKPQCALQHSPQELELFADSCSTLSLLAKACPMLQGLVVTGGITPHMLSVFGEECPNLVELDGDALFIPFAALFQLHNCLPNLKRFAVTENGKLDPVFVSSFCGSASQAISLCTRLTTLVLPRLSIWKESIWDQLPTSLRILDIRSFTCLPSLGTTLPALQQLFLDPDVALGSIHTSLQTVGRIMQAAPSLEVLQIPLLSSCAEGDLSSISALQTRFAGGLRIRPLVLKNEAGVLGAMMALVPPLCEINDLALSFGNPDNTFTHLARVFPSLVQLRMYRPSLTDDNASLLLGLSVLRMLQVTDCAALTDVGALVCMQLPALRQLCLSYCDGVSGTSVMQAQAREGLEIVIFNR